VRERGRCPARLRYRRPGKRPRYGQTADAAASC
jgi:hypothetical protein